MLALESRYVQCIIQLFCVSGNFHKIIGKEKENMSCFGEIYFLTHTHNGLALMKCPALKECKWAGPVARVVGAPCS